MTMIAAETKNATRVVVEEGSLAGGGDGEGDWEGEGEGDADEFRSSETSTVIISREVS